MLYLKNIIIHSILFFGLVFTYNSFAGEEAPESVTGTVRVTAEEIFELFDAYDDLIIIDSRLPEDREKGYIEGSIGIPDTETDESIIALYVTSKESPVVFYCNGAKCGRSVTAAEIAVDAGYKKVYWFRGGWEEWIEKGYPVTKGD